MRRYIRYRQQLEISYSPSCKYNSKLFVLLLLYTSFVKLTILLEKYAFLIYLSDRIYVMSTGLVYPESAGF